MENYVLRNYWSDTEHAAKWSGGFPYRRERTRHSMIRVSVWFVFAILFVATGTWAAPGGKVVIDVDSAKREMRVLRDEKVLMVFNPVSVGRWGVSEKKLLGDGKTPVGEFRVAWLQASGEFGPFIGIDYPSLARAEKGLAANEIRQDEFDAIKRAHAAGRIPPQRTRLGGYIGIHGLGRGDPEIHHDLNWTKGCIAVTNAEMETLLKWVRIGSIVKIH